MLVKVIAILSLLALTHFAYRTFLPSEVPQDMAQLFTSWKVRYNKSYTTSEEDSYRFEVFCSNYKLINEWNANPKDTYTMAINKFSDLTPEEFAAQYLSGIPPSDPQCPSANNTCPEISGTPAAQVNWTEAGGVTPIKNQGQCGSCWAFSAVQSLEGLLFINKSVLINLSEQQVVDCDKNDNGCGGGWPYLALVYTGQYGIEPNAVYPYVAQPQTCKYNANLALKVNNNWQCVTQKSLQQFQAAVTMQPVSIALQAQPFQNYNGGVISGDCDATMDHGVLITGYGPLEGYDGTVWYIKNTFGADWGVNGYVFISASPTPNEGYGVCGVMRCGVIPTNNQS